MHNVIVADGDVVLWDAVALFVEAEAYESEYITDVFRKGSTPPPRAIAVAIGEPGPETEIGPAEGPWIIGMAAVYNTRGVSQGKAGTRFEPWTRITPIPLRVALEIALGSDAPRVEEPRPMVAERLTPDRATRLLRFLGDHDESVGPWLRSIARQVPDGVDQQLQSRVEARDAVGLAGILANVEVPGSALRRRIAPDTESLMESVLSSAHRADLEEDLLPDELRRFDGLTRAEMYSASTAVFRTREIQLTVFNVNKKTFEVALGVDLIYWDVTHDVFTLVQYKRLERQNDRRGQPGTWAYHRKNEIAKQLELMPRIVNKPSTSRDWRMTQSPFWFKFVRGDGAQSQDGHLLRGMYLPADYLRLAMNDGSLMTGPQKGFRIDYDNVRHLDRGTFVHLIKQGLIGTASEQSADLHEVVTDLTAQGRSVVLAMKTRWNAAAASASD